MEQLLWNLGVMLFGGSLLFACIMDLREQMVYRFVWLIAGMAAGMLIIVRASKGDWAVGMLLEFSLYVGLQQLWFSRFYGRADCHAFCVCALAMWAMDMGMKDWLIHMLLTFAGLSVVQFACCNVKRNGKLKKPVPLIPYIALAFVLWVDFKGGKWYI